MTRSREVRLKSRPAGLPTFDNFELAQVDLPEPGEGEVQVRNTWMSVDPYMRGRMNAARSYAAPYEVGQVMYGGAIGEVTASNSDRFRPGDLVQSNFAWREAFNAPAEQLTPLDPQGLPPQAFLGAAGMPGLTAYVGLLRVAALKPGDVVFVSAASGAVGSMVCQIAKLRGHTVIGSAGGAEKARFVKEELGADHVIDYKAVGDLTDALLEAAPDGIDVYFENVGGAHLEAALAAAKPFARFALCGMISQYNATEPVGPRNIALAVGKSLRLEGFIVSNHADMRDAFVKDLSQWAAEGKLRWKETVLDGLDKAPEAFLGLFKGENFGKMLVKLA